jgi:hypothetical protein
VKKYSGGYITIENVRGPLEAAQNADLSKVDFSELPSMEQRYDKNVFTPIDRDLPPGPGHIVCVKKRNFVEALPGAKGYWKLEYVPVNPQQQQPLVKQQYLAPQQQQQPYMYDPTTNKMIPSRQVYLPQTYQQPQPVSQQQQPSLQGAYQTKPTQQFQQPQQQSTAGQPQPPYGFQPGSSGGSQPPLVTANSTFSAR